MKDINLKKINCFLDELITETKEYVFREIDIPMQPEYWFKSNISIIKSGKIKHINSEDSLKLSVNIDTHAYFSYKDTGINFVTIPSFECDLLSNKKYRVKFEGICDEGLDVKFYVIGYDDNKKIQHLILDINEEADFEIKSNCKKYRLALRFAGVGKIEIKSINFKPVKGNRVREWLKNDIEGLKIFNLENLSDYKLIRNDVYDRILIDSKNINLEEMEKNFEEIINLCSISKYIVFIIKGSDLSSKNVFNKIKSLKNIYEIEYYFLEDDIVFKIKDKRNDKSYREIAIQLREEKVKLAQRLINAYQKEEYMLGNIARTIKVKEELEIVNAKKIIKLREEKLEKSKMLLAAYEKEEYLLKSIKSEKNKIKC